jgi:hypothetical protein
MQDPQKSPKPGSTGLFAYHLNQILHLTAPKNKTNRLPRTRSTDPRETMLTPQLEYFSPEITRTRRKHYYGYAHIVSHFNRPSHRFHPAHTERKPAY